MMPNTVPGEEIKQSDALIDAVVLLLHHHQSIHEIGPARVDMLLSRIQSEYPNLYLEREDDSNGL